MIQMLGRQMLPNVLSLCYVVDNNYEGICFQLLLWLDLGPLYHNHDNVVKVTAIVIAYADC